MKEYEMFEPVKALLLKSNFDNVYAEVCNYDVVATSENAECIVEMKLHLNFKVLEQAYQGIGRAKYVYIAVPKTKQYDNNFVRKILRDYGIGLIVVDNNTARVHIESAVHEVVFGNIRDAIRPYNSVTVGGVKSGDGITEYSITISKIKEYMKVNDWLTVNDIIKNVDTHYTKPENSIGATLRAKWNEGWCEFKSVRGKSYFRYKTSGDPV